MQYDLSRLGDAEFEDLSQALAIRVLGTSVRVFGDGPDGGREATFEGRLAYPEPSPDGVWDGYGVVQAKYRRQLTTTAEDTAWFIRQAKGELQRWRDPTSKRVRNGRIPEYILFTTNIALSGVPGAGVDRVRQVLETYSKDLGLRGWDIWHRDQICRYLDVHPEIRRTYAGFLTSGDVLAELEKVLDQRSAQLALLLSSHAAKEMLAQKYIRLSEAGGSGTDRLYLGDVAIDLPADLSADYEFVRRPNRSRPTRADEAFSGTGIIAEIVRNGDAVHRAREPSGETSHMVVIGGPGQGKSTIGQLVCQAYRVALLTNRPASAIGPEADALLRRLERDLQQLGIPVPGCRRWPVQISLGRYGDALAHGQDATVLQHLAARLQPRILISEIELKEWLRSWPWLLVLDGLDEVPEAAVREMVMARISDFLVDSAEVDADILIVSTTRPQGYGREFAAPFYQHWILRGLNPSEAMAYARRLARARHADDPDFLDQVVERGNWSGACDPLMIRRLRACRDDRRRA